MTGTVMADDGLTDDGLTDDGLTHDGLTDDGLTGASQDASGETEVPGLLRRVRRMRRLNQRMLAALLGVSAGQVAKWESGVRDMSVGMLSKVLALAGLRIVALDADDRPVRPMKTSAAVRDRGGRLFPAHLDVAPRREFNPFISWPDERDAHMVGRGRAAPLRSGGGGADDDHPSAAEVASIVEAGYAAGAELVRQRKARNAEIARRSRDPAYDEECCCLVECHDQGPCVDACGCQCETLLGLIPV